MTTGRLSKVELASCSCGIKDVMDTGGSLSS